MVQFESYIYVLCIFFQAAPKFLLPPVRHQDMNKKCVVIDLDETLVHSSFKVSLSVCLSVECNLRIYAQ